MSEKYNEGYRSGYENGCEDATENYRKLVENRDARIAELEAALKPFADKCKLLDDGSVGDKCVFPFSFAMGDLRAARAALENKNV